MKLYTSAQYIIQYRYTKIQKKLLRLKWAYQRAMYGYDETIIFDFESYIGAFIPQLKTLCEIEIEDIEDVGNKEVYQKTLDLINERDNLIDKLDVKLSIKDFKKVIDKLEKKKRELWRYIGGNMRYYYTYFM